MIRTAHYVLICFALSACTEPAAPQLKLVEPASGSDNIATEVVIIGTGFYLGVDERYDGASTLRRDFGARLGDAPLTSVAWVDTTHLRATVPAGLPVGLWELVVTSPEQRSVRLVDAFEVRAAATPAPGGGQAARVLIVSAPTALTAGGVGSALIVARVTNATGEGVTGERVAFSTALGTFGATEEVGGGDYRARYTAPAAASDGTTRLLVSDAGPTVIGDDSVTVTLMATCASATAVVSSDAALQAAVAAANSGSTPADLCIPAATTIYLSAPLVLNAAAGVTLRGEAGATLSGGALGGGTFGVTLASAAILVRGIDFVAFTGGALALDGSHDSVEQCRFSGCTPPIAITGDDATIGPGNELTGTSEVGIDVDGQRAAVIGNRFDGFTDGAAVAAGTETAVSFLTVRGNVFLAGARAILLKACTDARLDNNTFVGLAESAVRLEPLATQIRARNNIFAACRGSALVGEPTAFAEPPAHNDFFDVGATCTGCLLGDGNLFVDPAFVAAARDDYRLSRAPVSPCIDAGVGVGDTYLGAAPDLGAYEAE